MDKLLACCISTNLEVQERSSHNCTSSKLGLPR